MIYLDHNATTPLDSRALEAMLPYLTERWGNPSSPYRFGSQARIALEQSRKRIAGHIGCAPAELVFCASGTEADNLAVRGAAYARRAQGNHIITTAIEHHAVLNTCKALEKEGFRVTYAPVTPEGTVDLAALAANIGEQTILISVMHANNETGVLQPLEEIAALAKHHGILLHTDAVQTAGKLPLPLAATGADFISFSAHKLYGPKGIAALYVRRGTPLVSIITGGAQERGIRAGTENVAGSVGFAEAVALAYDSAESEGQRLRLLRDQFEQQVLAAVPGTRINGARSPRVPNTSNITFESIDGESVVLGLDLQGICASTGSACSTGDPEPSHVLLAMGINPRAAQGSLRISLGRSTQAADISAAVEALRSTVHKLRTISSIGGTGSAR